MKTLMAEAEIAWSPQSFIATGNVPHAIDGARWNDHRCRLSRRGVTSHAAPYMDVGSTCTPEYEGWLAPWGQPAGDPTVHGDPTVRGDPTVALAKRRVAAGDTLQRWKLPPSHALS